MSFLLSARRWPLLGALLCLASGTIGYGQVIKPNKGGASCELTPECKPHKYTFYPAGGQTFHHWQVLGDLKLLSSADQNPAEVCSAGYGKGRLVAHYYIFRKDEKCREQCPDTLWHTLEFDVFKQFKAPVPIVGPTCVAPGQTVAFAVAPLLTDWPHRAPLIGADSYFWDGFPAGSTLAFSGDSSAVLVTLPDPLPVGGFGITAQIGRCNAAWPAKLEVGLEKPLADCLSIVQPPQAGQPYGVTIQTQPGVTYTVDLPATWTFANGSGPNLVGNGQPQTVYFNLAACDCVGNLLIMATGGCRGAQSCGFVLP